jgi:hypothetical protein
VKEDRRRYVVRNVSHEQVVVGAGNSSERRSENVGFHDAHPRVIRVMIPESCGESAVVFDRDETTHLVDQVIGECAATRPHFDDSVLATRPNGVGNAFEDGVVS